MASFCSGSQPDWPLQRLDGGDAADVAGDVKDNHAQTGVGQSLPVVQNVFAQRMREAIKELAGDVGFGFGNQMVVPGFKVGTRRGVKMKGERVCQKSAWSRSM